MQTKCFHWLLNANDLRYRHLVLFISYLNVDLCHVSQMEKITGIPVCATSPRPIESPRLDIKLQCHVHTCRIYKTFHCTVLSHAIISYQSLKLFFTHGAHA